MSRDGLAAATRFLVLALSALYSLAAIAGLVLVDFTSTRDPVFWTVLRAARPDRRRGDRDLQRRARAASCGSGLMRHTRTGWWLEEAGEITPTAPLDGDAGADVVVVGGGYLGLWTAWQLKELEPELDVLVLEAAVCGHGPSGRNGGFCETLWGDATTLREQAGDAAALAVCRASEDAVHGIGAWCEANGVDAWFREAPMLRVATTESQLGSWDESVRRRGRARRAGRARRFVGRGGARPLRVAAVPRRRAPPAERHRPPGSTRTRAAGEAARAWRAHPRAHGGDTPRPRRRRRHPQLARVARARLCSPSTRRRPAFPGYRMSLAVASSHIVLTEPIPDVLEELGWTGGEAVVDSRTLVHYTRTTRDGRIVVRLGRRGYGRRRPRVDRLELDRDVVAATREASAASSRRHADAR